MGKVDQSCIEYPPPAFSPLKSTSQTLNSQDIHHQNQLVTVDQSCVEYPPPESVCEENVGCDIMVPSSDLGRSSDGDYSNDNDEDYVPDENYLPDESEYAGDVCICK